MLALTSMNYFIFNSKQTHVTISMIISLQDNSWRIKWICVPHDFIFEYIETDAFISLSFSLFFRLRLFSFWCDFHIKFMCMLASIIQIVLIWKIVIFFLFMVVFVVITTRNSGVIKNIENFMQTTIKAKRWNC